MNYEEQKPFTDPDYEPQYDYDIDGPFEQEPTFVTNFDKEDKQKYLRAIAEYEKQYPDKKGRLYIQDKAYTITGGLLENNNSLHCLENFSLSPFWRIKEELDKESEKIMGYYISYVERYKKFEINQTSATKEEYDKRPRSNIAAPAIGTFVGISRYFEVYGEAVKACEIANKYLMDDNKIYEIPDNCIKDTALFKMYKCEECGRYWMKNNMFKFHDEKLCPYCRKAPGYTDNPKEPKTKYLICFKNLGTGAVHKGGNIFEDEEEAGQFCIKLNAGSPNIIKALGEYIYVPIQE